jgi:WD40 repeat protein
LEKINNNILAVGSSDGYIYFIDYNRGVINSYIRPHHYEIVCLLLFRDGLLLSAGNSSFVRSWELDELELYKNIPAHKDKICHLIKISKLKFASCSDDFTIKIWNTIMLKPMYTLTEHTHYVSKLLKIKINMLASASWDNNIIVWCLRNKAVIRKLTGHTYYVSALANIDNNHIASGSWDCTIRIWDISNGQCISIFKVHKEEIVDIIRISEEILFSSGADGIYHLNYKTGVAKHIELTMSNSIVYLNHLKWFGHYEKCCLIFRPVDNDNIESRIKAHEEMINSIIKISDNVVATCGDYSQIKIWNIVKNIQIKTIDSFNEAGILLTQEIN